MFNIKNIAQVFKRKLVHSTINGETDFTFLFRFARQLKSAFSVYQQPYKKGEVVEVKKQVTSDTISGSLKVSVLLPVYNTPETFLREAIQSVLYQTYSNWELCIADDNSSLPHVKTVLEEYKVLDARIKVTYRSKNGHISKNTNTALKLATGDFIAFFDHDDLLHPQALEKVVTALEQQPRIDLVYTDEDKIDENGSRCLPHRKPSWSPDTLLTRNYITHFVVARKAIVDQLGGLRTGVEGSQDHDFLLRFSEVSQAIFHVPEILYHWRIHSESVAAELGAKPYVIAASKKAIQDSLDRQGVKGTVRMLPNLPLIFAIDYDKQTEASVAIVWQGVAKETALIKSNLKQKGEVLVSNYFRENSSQEVPALANEDYVLYIDASLKICTEGWLAKCVNAMAYSYRGSLSVPIYNKDGSIYSMGLDENGNGKFQGLFTVPNDDHDYYASSLNVKLDHKSLFLLTKLDSKRKSDLLLNPAIKVIAKL